MPIVLSYFLTIFRNPSPFISTNLANAVISVYAWNSGARVFPDGTDHEFCRFPLVPWRRHCHCHHRARRVGRSMRPRFARARGRGANGGETNKTKDGNLPTRAM